MVVLENASKKSHPDTVSLTRQEAFAAVLLGAVTADGKVSADEGIRVHQALRSMTLYREYSPDTLQALVGKVMELIEYYGIAPVVAWAAKSIPPHLTATAFAAATDLVLSDRRISGHERDLLDELQAVLQLDRETAGKIIDVLAVKNRG